MPGHWMGEAFTEVVMLAMASEPDFLPAYIAREPAIAAEIVRCGPPHALRPCNVTHEPALEQMGRVCAAHGGEPTGARVARQSGCALPDPNGDYPLPGLPHS
jgi:hypothetical protein